MRLLICMVTHNRLDYTKVALQSLRDTLMVPAFIVVVDNASEDGTVDYLHRVEGDLCDLVLTNTMNRYPGAACNRGWQMGLIRFPHATHLMRCDNDMEWLERGWDVEAREYFEVMPGLGQLGLMDMTDARDFPTVWHEEGGKKLNVGPTNIGGTHIMRRELWDMGLRYRETPWQNVGGPTPQEDVFLSLDIKQRGLSFGNVEKQKCREMSYTDTDKYYDYYVRTFTQRGHEPPARIKDGVVIEEGLHHI